VVIEDDVELWSDPVDMEVIKVVVGHGKQGIFEVVPSEGVVTSGPLDDVIMVDIEEGSVESVIVAIEEESLEPVMVAMDEESVETVMVAIDEGSVEPVMVAIDEGSVEPVMVAMDEGSVEPVMVTTDEGSVESVVMAGSVGCVDEANEVVDVMDVTSVELRLVIGLLLLPETILVVVPMDPMVGHGEHVLRVVDAVVLDPFMLEVVQVLLLEVIVEPDGTELLVDMVDKEEEVVISVVVDFLSFWHTHLPQFPWIKFPWWSTLVAHQGSVSSTVGQL